jgi:hypothetical protein
MTTLETLKAAVEQSGTAYELAKESLRDYKIANCGFVLGEKVEYGYPNRRKIGVVVGFREGYQGELRLIVAPVNKDGSTHATSRDSWPENPVKLEAL